MCLVRCVCISISLLPFLFLWLGFRRSCASPVFLFAGYAVLRVQSYGYQSVLFLLLRVFVSFLCLFMFALENRSLPPWVVLLLFRQCLFGIVSSFQSLSIHACSTCRPSLDSDHVRVVTGSSGVPLSLLITVFVLLRPLLRPLRPDSVMLSLSRQPCFIVLVLRSHPRRPRLTFTAS